MRWIGRPEKIQDRVPLNISARMDASRVLSLRIARIGGGRYLWMWMWMIRGVQRKKRVFLLTYDNPTRKLGEIILMVKGPKLVVVLQFWLLVDWYRFEKALIVDEDRCYYYPETVGLFYDTISKMATSTSKMVVQQESPGYSHLQPSLLPHLVLLLPLLKLCHWGRALPIR